MDSVDICVNEPHEILSYHSKVIRAKKIDEVCKVPLKNRDIKKLFRKGLLRLRGFLMWYSILKEIRVYGTNSHLFDSFGNYRIDICERLRYRVREYENRTEKQTEYGLVINPESNFYQFWNGVVLLMLLYVFIIMPWIMAFEEVIMFNGWYFAETTIDLICFFDIIVTLNTAYYDLLGRIVVNRRKIFFNYLKGLLVIDILSIIPFYLILDGKFLKSNSLIRIVRITSVTRVLRGSKVFKLIRYLKHSEFITKIIKILKLYRGMVRLILLIFCVVILSHFVACMFYFTARIDNFGPNTWIVRNDLIDSSNGMKYLKSLYFTITILTTVGFGDITPYTTLEMILCITWMMLGIAFYSTIVSTISSLFSSMDSRRFLISEQLSVLDQLGKFYNVDSICLKIIKQKISDHIILKKRVNEYEKIKIFKEMPKNIQRKLVNFIYKNCVSRFSFFKNKDYNFLIDILPRLNYTEYSKGVVVYNKHEQPDFVYFLLLGRVAYVLGSSNLQFKSIVNGTYFGEIEILLGVNRKFRVITEVYCEMLVIAAASFEELIAKFYLIGEEIWILANKRNKVNENCYKQVVQVVDVVEIKKKALLKDMAGKKIYKHRKLTGKELKIGGLDSIEDDIIHEIAAMKECLNSVQEKIVGFIGK